MNKQNTKEKATLDTLYNFEKCENNSNSGSIMLWSLLVVLGCKLWGFNINLDWHAMSNTMSIKH